MTEHRSIIAKPPVQVALITLIALAVRLAYVHAATPTYDEFYHLLAARSVLLDGSFSIGAGEYTRAGLFTRLVAMSTAVFGDSLGAGRVPAVLAGTLWVIAVFAWTRHVAGGAAAWGAGLLLALDPGAIHLSQWVRFYTLHGLLVWIGVISVYRLFTGPISRWRAVWIAAAGIGAFALSFTFVPSALIAAAAVAMWASAAAIPRLAKGLKRNPRLWWFVGVGAAVGLAGAAWAVTSGLAEAYWGAFTTPFPWQEGRTIDRRFYAWWLTERYPTLWSLFPLAVVAAVARFPRPALFATWMFGFSFVAVSFAPGQQERYLYFALPFLFVVWGLALASFVPALRSVAERALEAMRNFGLPARARGPAILACLVVTIGFVFSQNDASRMTLGMVYPRDGERPYTSSDWEAVLPRIEPLVDSADVVLSSFVLKPIYYLDRGDVHLSWAETAEIGLVDGRPVEFAINPKTGRPAISTPESLARVMACFPSGLVIVEPFDLNRPHLVPKATTEYLRAHTTEVPLPRESRVLAFRWRHETTLDAPGCPPWQPEMAAPSPRRAPAVEARAPVD